MANKIFIAENLTASEVLLEDIGIAVPASGSFDLTATLFVFEIQESTDLFQAIQNDEILINDGSSTLSKEDSLLVVTPPGEDGIEQNSDDIASLETSISTALDGYATDTDLNNHITDTANPHSTSIANIGSGTLAQLNAVVTDATLDSSSDSRTPTLHAATHEDGGADEINVTGLSGLLDDPQTPTTHASTHEQGGSDALEISNLGTSESDTALVLKPDGSGGVGWVTETSDAPTLAEVLAEGNATGGTDISMTAGDFITGTDGTVVIQNVRHYGTTAADPVSPPPSAGDRYYNTTLNEEMRYDASRSKWLAVATENVTAGRNGNTGAAVFYRGVGNLVLNATTRGIPVEQGTITYIGITRVDSDAATLEVLVNGSVVGTLAHSTAGLTENTSANIDFAGGLMSFRNQAGGNTTTSVQIVVRYKKRA